MELTIAKIAYDFAEEGAAISKKKEYKSYVKKIPSLIYKNGLSATLKFIDIKRNNQSNNDAYNILFNQIKKFLVDMGHSLNDPFTYVSSCDSNKYRKVTIEILSLFDWLKRFADGLIKED